MEHWVHFQKEWAAIWGETLSYNHCVFEKLVGRGSSEDSCFAAHDSLASGIYLCCAFIIYSFVWSIVGRNCSKVDQIWSIVPVVYCWHFFLHYCSTTNEIHYRMLLLASLVTLWGTRLTYNFWRKDGYGTFFTHEEDYRWPILRKKMHPVVFLIFNLTFIATYQNVLLFWIAVPAYEVINGPREIAVGDLVVAGLFAALLIMETVADEQHWVFQSLKHSIPPEQRSKLADPELRQGFYTSGLFKYSRHPNYFAEQAMWLCVFLYSTTPTIAAGLAASLPLAQIAQQCLHWTGLGCIQLMLLFQGSMNFGESITLSKYPAYKDYQAVTSMCIPMPSKGMTHSDASKKSN